MIDSSLNPRVLFLAHKTMPGLDPIGIMQLSAIAKRHNFATSLCTSRYDLQNVIREFKPDIIAVSMMSPDYLVLKEKIETIKKVTKIPVVVGGPHPTFKPDIIHDLNVDAICVGEGDMIFPTLLDNIINNESFDNLPNIHTRNKRNALGPLVENLDLLPFIDREILYENFPVFKIFRLRVFSASRGCPYHCSYCFNHAYNKLYKGLGKVVRRRSVDHLLTEIEKVSKNYPTEFVKFSDDSFVHGVDQWLEDFSNEYNKRVNIPFYCLIRPDRVNEDMVKLLKHAGCATVCMSIETGNERLRKEILHRNVNNDQIIRAFDLFHKYNINIFTNTMLAIPESSLESEIESIDLNVRCRPEFSGFSVCIPFPGTDIGEYCSRKNLIDKNIDEDYRYTRRDHSSVLNNFSKREKLAHKNLTFIAPLVVKFPFIKSFALKVLIYLPITNLYKLITFFIHKYQLKTKIIPIKYSLYESFLFMKEFLLHDFKNK